jgi:hypothetical protein
LRQAAATKKQENRPLKKQTKNVLYRPGQNSQQPAARQQAAACGLSVIPDPSATGLPIHNIYDMQMQMSSGPNLFWACFFLTELFYFLRKINQVRNEFYNYCRTK